MSLDRRYNEDEIAAIFKQASSDQEVSQSRLSRNDGLTITDLQEIGTEAGISAEHISRAANAIDRVVISSPPATYFGLQTSVSRTVDLPGPLSEESWDRLVVEMREMFEATGRIRRDGSLRQWSNGNLRILVEPTKSGHRLSMRTRKGNVQSSLAGGLLAFLTGILLLVREWGSGSMVALSILALIGLGSFGYSMFRLPRWAKLRERQMESLSALASEMSRVHLSETVEEPPRPLHDSNTHNQTSLTSGVPDILLDAADDPPEETHGAPKQKSRN